MTKNWGGVVNSSGDPVVKSDMLGGDRTDRGVWYLEELDDTTGDSEAPFGIDIKERSTKWGGGVVNSMGEPVVKSKVP